MKMETPGEWFIKPGDLKKKTGRLLVKPVELIGLHYYRKTFFVT